MLAHVNTFWVPKRGCSPDEYEDASWIDPPGDSSGELSAESIRVAISDGASESMLAGRWARHLVAMLGTAATPVRSHAGFIDAYRTAVDGWGDIAYRYVDEREQRGAPIQWFEEPGLIRGAYATILVLEFSGNASDEGFAWRGIAVGDSCLFQVRDEAVYQAFPMTESIAFNYQPSLLSSRGTEDDVLRRHIRSSVADWDRGDSFYIVTDALAAWFLRETERGNQPWQPLRDLDTRDAVSDFADWVDERRCCGEMRDDDTTLVRIDMC